MLGDAALEFGVDESVAEVVAAAGEFVEQVFGLLAGWACAGVVGYEEGVGADVAVKAV